MAQVLPTPDTDEAQQSRASDGFGDIVVTAQRRNERQSEIPASITAYTGEAVQKSGISDIRQLIQLTPGLSVQSFGSSAQPYVRGIGSNNATTGDSSNVALYIDGVYQPFQPANFARFDDIERVEVLKGPQGTLLGRNAAGGAISLITREPELGELAGKLSASYGTFNEIELNGFVSAPLGEKAALSLSGDFIENDGFRRDVYLNRRMGFLSSHSFRAKLLFEPTSDTRILLSGNYRWANDLTTFGNQPLNGNINLRAVNPPIPGLIIANEPNTSATNFVARNEITVYGASLKIDHDFEFATLTSLSAFTQGRNDIATDSDLTNIANNHSFLEIHDDTLQQDLYLTSRGDGPFTWLLGGMLYRETASVDTRGFGGRTTTDTTNLPFIRGTVVPDINIDAYALYAEITYKLADPLTITAGGRYSHDRPSFFGYRLLLANQQPDPASFTRSKASFSRFTPHLALRYAINPETNVYASYSRGFKSGVLNANSLQVAPVEPEDVYAYEVGIKHSSSTLTFDLAAYHYDYKNVQFVSYGTTTAVQILRNAAAAKIDGVDASITVRPVAGLSMRAGAAYTKARYTDFIGAPGFRPTTNAAGVPVGGNTQFPFNASGRPMIRTPKFQANGAITYEAELAGGGKISGNVNGSYFGKIYHDVAGNFPQPEDTVVNANLSYATPDDRWRFTAFANNVFDETYVVGVLISGAATSVTYNKPANFGGKVEFYF